MSPEATFLIGLAMLIAMKIVVFILGYLTIRMGYKLISSGVEGKFKFQAEIGGVKADLASMSPGLLFVLLGIMLIGIAVYIDKSIVFEPIETENTLVLPDLSDLPDELSINSTEDDEE